MIYSIKMLKLHHGSKFIKNILFGKVMNILLSIKFKYVEEFKQGNKKYKFRKAFCSRKNFNKIEYVYIYSNTPAKKIVARMLVIQKR